jgi:hypothetical protein
LDRVLEFDDRGRWCWPRCIVLVPRQSGKSTVARALCEWMAANNEAVLSTSAKLVTVAQLMRESMHRYRDQDGFTVKLAKDQPEIAWPHAGANKGRWISQAANEMLGRGFSVDLALVDEVQDVNVEAMESLAPAMSEADNPITVCFGTAARGPSELLNRMRDAGLRGDGVLLIEWSAPTQLPYDDEETWRVASPRWSEKRLRHIRTEVKIHAEAYIRSEYLCQPVLGGADPWLSLPDWERARRPLEEPDSPDVCVVEDGRGGDGATVGLAWRDADGVACVTAFRVRDLAEAWRYAGTAGKVLAGVTLVNEREARELRAKPVGRKETGTALPALRRLLPDELHWDGDALDEQVRHLEVHETERNEISLNPRSPSALVRCAAWAVQALNAGGQEPLLLG